MNPKHNTSYNRLMKQNEREESKQRTNSHPINTQFPLILYNKKSDKKSTNKNSLLKYKSKVKKGEQDTGEEQSRVVNAEQPRGFVVLLPSRFSSDMNRSFTLVILLFLLILLNPRQPSPHPRNSAQSNPTPPTTLITWNSP